MLMSISIFPQKVDPTLFVIMIPRDGAQSDVTQDVMDIS